MQVTRNMEEPCCSDWHNHFKIQELQAKLHSEDRREDIRPFWRKLAELPGNQLFPTCTSAEMRHCGFTSSGHPLYAAFEDCNLDVKVGRSSSFVH